MEPYTLDDVKAIIRELFKYDGKIEELLSWSDQECDREYTFDAVRATAILKHFEKRIERK